MGPEPAQVTRTRFCLSAGSGSASLPIYLGFIACKIVIEIYVVQSSGVVLFSLGNNFQPKPFQFSEAHGFETAASKRQVSFQGVCCAGLCWRKGEKSPETTTPTIFNQVSVLVIFE